MGVVCGGSDSCYRVLHLYGDATMKIKAFFKSFDYRHYICIAITLGFIACSVFVFAGAFGRIIESGRDFGLSVAYYFCELFGIPYSFTPTVNEVPAFTMPSYSPLPATWEEFTANWSAYWHLWATKENFVGYCSVIGQGLGQGAKILVLILPFIVIGIVLLRRSFRKMNNDYDRDTRPLRVWKAVERRTYRPVKLWLVGFFDFLREQRRYLIIWACIWVYNFNGFTIFLEFFAYYFYVVLSFDVVNLYRQVYKLFLDLAPLFMFVPLWAWGLFAALIMDCIRKKIAFLRLHHYERRNRGFINARPLVLMVCGTMGKGKTTVLTDMCLSTEVMFRDKAYEKMLDNDLKFPRFPWINFENELRRAIEHHQVFNLAMCRKFVKKKYLRWEKAGRLRSMLFNYDYERYGYTYDDKLKVVTIWDVLETYAQLYFIYIMESSLLISNYSIRTDIILQDVGNFPLWDADFFRRDSRRLAAHSRHAHILDQDILRIGRAMVEDNRYRYAFEFGVVAISEIGKERRNMLELQEMKKKTDETNQKNDGFNDGLKMRRHSATVDNFAFLKIIADEQRPEDLGAGARDLFDVVHICERSDDSLAMPFFSLEELVFGWLYRKFENLYSEYRFNRGDNTLLMHLLKGLTAAFKRYYTRIYNRFGYNCLTVEIESGTLDGNRERNRYWLMWKKIYSKRFATDCVSGFFEERVLHSDVGIADMDEYETERATWEELKKQNSYFVRDLVGKNDFDHEQKKVA